MPRPGLLTALPRISHPWRCLPGNDSEQIETHVICLHVHPQYVGRVLGVKGRYLMDQWPWQSCQTMPPAHFWQEQTGAQDSRVMCESNLQRMRLSMFSSSFASITVVSQFVYEQYVGAQEHGASKGKCHPSATTQDGHGIILGLVAG